jgi:hypothetical protein
MTDEEPTGVGGNWDAAVLVSMCVHEKLVRFMPTKNSSARISVVEMRFMCTSPYVMTSEPGVSFPTPFEASDRKN